MSNENLGFNFHEKILNNYCRRANESSKYKYESEKLLKLMEVEISEAIEFKSIGQTEQFKEKLADITVKMLELCGKEGINLGEEVEKKLV